MRKQTWQLNCEVQELNVPADPVHLIVQIPPKLSISDYMGRLKGKTAIRVFSAFRDLRQRRYGAIIFGLKATVLARWAWTEK